MGAVGSVGSVGGEVGAVGAVEGSVGRVVTIGTVVASGWVVCFVESTDVAVVPVGVVFGGVFRLQPTKSVIINTILKMLHKDFFMQIPPT